MKKIALVLLLLVMSSVVLTSGCIGGNSQAQNTTTTQQSSIQSTIQQTTSTTTTIPQKLNQTNTQTQNNTTQKQVTKLILSTEYASVYYIGSDEYVMNYLWKINTFNIKANNEYYTIIDFQNIPQNYRLEIVKGVSGYTSNIWNVMAYSDTHIEFMLLNSMEKDKLMNVAFRVYKNDKFDGYIAIVPKKYMVMNTYSTGNINSVKVLSSSVVTPNSEVKFEFTGSVKLFSEGNIPSNFKVKLIYDTNIPSLSIDENSSIELDKDGTVQFDITASMLVKYILEYKGKPASIFGALYYDDMKITEFKITINGLFDSILEQVKINEVQNETISNSSVQVISISGYEIKTVANIDSRILNMTQDSGSTFNYSSSTVLTVAKLKIDSDSNKTVFIEFKDSDDRILYSMRVPLVKGENYISVKFLTEKYKDNTVEVSIQNVEDKKYVYRKKFTVKLEELKQLPVNLDISEENGYLKVSYDGSKLEGDIYSINTIMMRLDSDIMFAENIRVSNIIMSNSTTGTTFRTLFVDTPSGRYVVNSLAELLSVLVNKNAEYIGYYDQVTGKEYRYKITEINAGDLEDLMDIIRENYIQYSIPPIYLSLAGGDSSYSIIGIMLTEGYPNNGSVSYITVNQSNIKVIKYGSASVLLIKNADDKGYVEFKITQSNSQEVAVIVMLMESVMYGDYLFDVGSIYGMMPPYNIIVGKIITLPQNTTQQTSSIPSGDYYLGEDLVLNNNTVTGKTYLIDVTEHYNITDPSKIPSVFGNGEVVSYLWSKDGHLLVELANYDLNTTQITDNYGNTIELDKLSALNLVNITYSVQDNRTLTFHINNIECNNTYLVISVSLTNDFDGLKYITITYNGQELSANSSVLETYSYMGIPLPIYGIKVKSGDTITITITNTTGLDSLMIYPMIITDGLTFSAKLDEMLTNNNFIVGNIIIPDVYEFKVS